VPKYAAFLRAINLGRNRRVSGADLRSLFEGMGFEDVATFRTSGNVVFSAGREAGLGGLIEARLEEELGYEVGVFLRTEKEVLAIGSHEPFERKLVEASEGKLQVALLGKKPAKRAREEALALSTEDDRLAFGERELYWLPRGGTQDSELDRDALVGLIGTTTFRTKGTIEQLAAKYFGG